MGAANSQRCYLNSNNYRFALSPILARSRIPSASPLWSTNATEIDGVDNLDIKALPMHRVAFACGFAPRIRVAIFIVFSYNSFRIGELKVVTRPFRLRTTLHCLRGFRSLDQDVVNLRITDRHLIMASDRQTALRTCRLDPHQQTKAHECDELFACSPPRGICPTRSMVANGWVAFGKKRS